jgi:hypothetical protein
VSRIDQHLIRQLQHFVMQAVIEHACQLLGRVRAGEIWATHVTNKQCVTRQHGPRFDRLLIIGDHQADAFQSMSRSFENLDLSFAEAQFKAVVNGHVLEGGSSLSAKINFRPSAGREFLVSRDEIGVQVRFTNMADGETVFFGSLQVKVYVTLGINHNRFALRPEHIRGMGQAAKIKLFEVHRQTPLGEFAAEETGQLIITPGI